MFIWEGMQQVQNLSVTLLSWGNIFNVIECKCQSSHVAYCKLMWRICTTIYLYTYAIVSDKASSQLSCCETKTSCVDGWKTFSGVIVGDCIST